MKIKKIDQLAIHNFVSKQFGPRDGTKVMWVFGKATGTKEGCIFAACGTEVEIKAWADQIAREKGMEIRQGFGKKVKN